MGARNAIKHHVEERARERAESGEARKLTEAWRELAVARLELFLAVVCSDEEMRALERIDQARDRIRALGFDPDTGRPLAPEGGER